MLEARPARGEPDRPQAHEEMVWELEAENLGPMVVAVDAHGRDLYKDVRLSAKAAREAAKGI